MSTTTTEKPGLVTLDYNDLVEGKDLTSDILKAYGPNGLGALTIKNIPKYAALRKKLLPLSHKVAHLSDASKKKLEHEESMYNVGWSHGKEKMGDKPDYAKGSFYANPKYDVAASDEEIKAAPFFYPKNIWPKDDLPELEPAFKDLGAVMYDVVVLLAKQIDQLTLKHVEKYQANLLHNAMSNTKKIKGRLLYYYPPSGDGNKEGEKKNDDADTQEDGWIGWHNDSGFLTALTSDMYFDNTTGKEVPSPDAKAGLYIVDRDSNSIQVTIPNDELAVQCGECLQILTGGLLVATPHCVRAGRGLSPEGNPVGRVSFPVFVDTAMQFPLSSPEGVTREEVFTSTVTSKVPPLEKRWLKQKTPFVQFLGDTFKQYYEWSQKDK